MSIFSKEPVFKPKSSRIPLNWQNKLSCNFGQLIPILTEDVVPGDRFKVSSEVYLQFAPMLAPVMHEVNVRVDYFFVPYRILWKNWEKFITNGGEKGYASGETPPVMPYISPGMMVEDGFSEYLQSGSLLDYLGVPPMKYIQEEGEYDRMYPLDSDPLVGLDLLAYQKIYNEWYRDQNLQDEIAIPDGDGQITPDEFNEAFQLRYRCWEKDEFASALPFPQRGEDVKLPIGTKAPVDANSDWIGDNAAIDFAGSTDSNRPYRDGNGVAIGTTNQGATFDGGNLKANDSTSPRLAYHDHGYTGEISDTSVHSMLGRDANNEPAFEADLSQASMLSIQDLRWYTSIQRFLEKNARAGGRYIEQILLRFGVRVPDYRLDRPEYLGGSVNPAVISSVMQSANGGESGTPIGQQYGHMASHGFASGKYYRIEEHGVVMGIMSIMPRTCYADGLRRKFFKFDCLDYYVPELQHLGEQPIYNAQLYAFLTSNPESDKSGKGTWGYEPRYTEYKYHPSEVHGEMRYSLNYWHLGRLFNDLPRLNADFVSTETEANDNEGLNRIFANPNYKDEHIYCYIANHMKFRRPMLRYAYGRL